MAEPAGTGVPPVGGHTVLLAPLSLPAIIAVLDERGDRYVVTGDGQVGGRWGQAVVHWRATGRRGEVLHARVVPDRRLPAQRRLAAYRFCNAWNHDKLLPAVHVRDDDAGGLVIVGEVSVDLEHGVAHRQLAAFVDLIVSAGTLLARAVGGLPDQDPLP